MMKILILYFQKDSTRRKTIDDHLFCFKKYIKQAEFYYCNVLYSIPFYVSWIHYDAIILHYTLLSVRWEQEYWKRHYFKELCKLKYFQGYKIAIPQDENAYTQELCELFKQIGVKTVFTCAFASEYEKLYPKKETGLENYFTVYTGYVDEETKEIIDQFLSQKTPRTIDIGYRARKVPYWLGMHGQLKYEIGQRFLGLTDADITMDISHRDKDVYFGIDWLKFLLRCRTVLGCLGGASLLDVNGSIREKVEKYLLIHPYADFSEVKNKFFREIDGNLQLFALSPRHFECCMTKTCQILLEGDYDGVLEPAVHFIELKKDFSNIDKVIALVKDKAHCEKIAERAYQDIVLSSKYTYKHFAEKIFTHIQEKKTPSKENSLLSSLVKLLLRWREIAERPKKKFLAYFFYLSLVLPQGIKKGWFLLQSGQSQLLFKKIKAHFCKTQ